MIRLFVRDKKPSLAWREIAHYIFEVPHAKGGLFERLEKVKPYAGRVIKMVQQIHVKDKKHLQSFLKEIEQKGGDS